MASSSGSLLRLMHLAMLLATAWILSAVVPILGAHSTHTPRTEFEAHQRRVLDSLNLIPLVWTRGYMAHFFTLTPSIGASRARQGLALPFVSRTARRPDFARQIICGTAAVTPIAAGPTLTIDGIKIDTNIDEDIDKTYPEKTRMK